MQSDKNSPFPQPIPPFRQALRRASQQITNSRMFAVDNNNE
ncbi:hypothetical protein ACFOGG_12630 [Brenneria rubrifaciens]